MLEFLSFALGTGFGIWAVRHHQRHRDASRHASEFVVIRSEYIEARTEGFRDGVEATIRVGQDMDRRGFVSVPWGPYEVNLRQRMAKELAVRQQERV